MNTTKETAELLDLGKQIRQWQELKKLSNNEMLRRFPGLGSDKTYRRVTVTNDLAELDIEKQLDNYRAVHALIESLAESGGAQDELYDDLSPAVALRRAVVEILAEQGDARVVLMEGDSGMGKTKSLRLLQQKYGQRVLVAEASDAWDDNPNALLGVILHALGVREQPVSRVERLRALVERLRGSRLCLVIDEAHHMGPRCLNTVKTLVNQTPGEFVLLAMPTLWRRLERDAYQEVRQLTGNRLAERIRLDALREGDLKKMLERRLPKFSGDTKLAIRLLLNHAPRYGNLAFVRAVIKEALQQADGEPVTQETFSAAVAAEMERR